MSRQCGNRLGSTDATCALGWSLRTVLLVCHDGNRRDTGGFAAAAETTAVALYNSGLVAAACTPCPRSWRPHGSLGSTQRARGVGMDTGVGCPSASNAVTAVPDNRPALPRRPG